MLIAIARNDVGGFDASVPLFINEPVITRLALICTPRQLMLVHCITTKNELVPVVSSALAIVGTLTNEPWKPGTGSAASFLNIASWCLKLADGFTVFFARFLGAACLITRTAFTALALGAGAFLALTLRVVVAGAGRRDRKSVV